MPRASRAKSARILLGAVGHASPVEDCLLIDDKGRPLFRLSDYYGSFANDQRLKTQTTKDLPTADPLLTDFLFGLRQPALAHRDRRSTRSTTAHTNDDPKPQHRYAQAALRHSPSVPRPGTDSAVYR